MVEHLDNPATMSKNLLNDLKIGKLTLDQFNTKCAYWLTDPTFWNNIKPSEPSTREVEDKMMNSTKNRTWLENLKIYKTYIPKSDRATIDKYDERIKEFDKWIRLS